MSFYERYCLPHIIGLACNTKDIQEQRNQVVPMAEGRVLEVGIGPGLNLPFYNPDKVDFVWGLEPSEGMHVKARKNLEKSSVEVKWLDLPGEEIPLEDNSVDTVLLTFTLCTIPDWLTALQQMRRVLKPGGKLLYCEHGIAPDESIKKWQNKLDPYWNIISGGCHLNRPISHYIEESGFKINTLETEYLSDSPKLLGYIYRGIAAQA